MSKLLVILSTWLWIVVAVTLTIILVILLSSSFWKKESNLNKKSTIYESIVTEDIDSIVINWISGSINVVPHNESYVKVEQNLSTEITEKNKMSVLVFSRELQISDNRSHLFWLFGDFHSTAVTIFLPEAKYLSFLSINGVSSQIAMRNVKAEEIHVKSISGRINLENVDAKKIDSNVVSGKVYMNGNFLDIVGKSVSGSVEIHSTIMPERMAAHSVSGKVRLYIPENEGFLVRFSKVSGKLTSDFPLVVQNEHEYRFGNGKSNFSVEVVSGDCTIYKN